MGGGGGAGVTGNFGNYIILNIVDMSSKATDQTAVLLTLFGRLTLLCVLSKRKQLLDFGIILLETMPFLFL